MSHKKDKALDLKGYVLWQRKQLTSFVDPHCHTLHRVPLQGNLHVAHQGHHEVLQHVSHHTNW